MRHRAPLAGVFAGMFYVTNPMMFVTFAGEMPLQMALILWGLVAYRAERPQIAAAILACASLTRPDGLLAAAVVFGYDVVVRRRILWRAWLVFARDRRAVRHRHLGRLRVALAGHALGEARAA